MHRLRGALLVGSALLIAKLFLAGEMVRYMSPALDPLAGYEKALRVTARRHDVIAVSEGVNVEVQNGKVWVTQEGDSSDHVLGAGDSFRTSGNGLVIVQALQDSAFRFRGMSQHATA